MGTNQADGLIIASDTRSHALVVLDLVSEEVVRTIETDSSEGLGDGQFDSPAGVTVLANDRLAVCD